MIAAASNRNCIKHLVYRGACVGAKAHDDDLKEALGPMTAVAMLRKYGGTAAQIAYLEVRESCANPGCNGGGRKRCCCVCKETRYCGMVCRRAHWRVHQVDCRPDRVLARAYLLTSRGKVTRGLR
jgi:hypothetical protein